MKKYLISIDSDDGVRLKNFFAQQIFATCKNDFMKFGVKGAELTVKEYFDLDVKQTLKTWTVLETIIAVVGLGMVMLMSIWVH